MRLKVWNKAYPALQEALKQKWDSWKIVENMMICAIALGKWRDVVQHMNKLLDMRLKSQRPVHIDELRHLCFIISHNEKERFQQDNKVCELTNNSEILLSEIAQSVEKLIIRITNTIPSDPEIWDIFAEFNRTLNRHRLAMDSRVKQVRQ
jgi:hypothetical protein